MTIYTLNDIARAVKIAIDQNSNSGELTLIGDTDTLGLNEIIKSKVVEAVKRIHCAAPIHLLDGGYDFASPICWNPNTMSGWIILPDDFMRFVGFKMDDWDRAVYSALETDDDEYMQQSSRFKGLRGSPQRPVCAIAVRPEGRVLEFYSCKTMDAKISMASYIPYPKVDEYDGVEICDKCYDAIIYTTAALALTAIGEVERSNVFNEMAKTTLI